MHSDQMRKYGISETQHSWEQSHNKDLYYGLKDAILSHLATVHQAPGASCGILYILVFSLV